jgi:preprotein translocase subunit SecE
MMSDDKGKKPEKGNNKDKESGSAFDKASSWVKAKYKEFRAEFKRIQWPSRADLLKETLTVVVICAIFGAFIALLDWGFGFGFSAFANLIAAR